MEPFDMSPQQPFRVGVIGAGAAGEMRATALARIPEARLVSVADSDLERAGALAKRHGAASIAEPEALVNSPEVDGVIISTPPSSHEPLGLAALKARKHVLCEKPLAITVEACQRLLVAASDAGVCLATGFNLRQTPAARLARALVDDGAIGRVDHVRAFHGHSGGEYFGPRWTVDRKTTGGGALMDGGIHMIDMARWFLGETRRSVGLATENVWRQPGCEDNGFVLLETEDGRIGQVQASWTEWRGYRYHVEVYGSEGYVRFGYSPLWLVHARNRPDQKARVRRHLFPIYQVVERLRSWRWSLGETIFRDTADWLRAIARGEEAAASGRDGMEAVRIAQCVDRPGKGSGD